MERGERPADLQRARSLVTADRPPLFNDPLVEATPNRFIQQPDGRDVV
jgi:hypothetical protein